ncbi:MAG TPA: metalloregulator ArsR/SmtB family transcription factor [Candidatus Limnocylindria bacterium]|nr:metalloregulator ArsR/SmtB family transcription factor [Candidatus Limnocylindria bacterium]
MDAFAALAEPRRREILRLVTSGELSVGEIARRFEVTRPAISQHLRVLKDAGLVTERREGTRRLYRARPETLAELRAYLDAFWDDSLRSLKTAAEHEEQQRRSKRDRRHEGH